MVIPTFWASCVTLIFLFASMTSMLIIISSSTFHLYTVRSFSLFMSAAFSASFETEPINTDRHTPKAQTAVDAKNTLG